MFQGTNGPRKECSTLIRSDVDLDSEFRHVKARACSNHLMLNFSKTKELVFKRPRARCFHMWPAIDSTEQLDCCKLLGVIFQSNFNMDAHVQYLLTQCSQHMYIFKLLRQTHQGMPLSQLSLVAHSIIVSRILYALPARVGFLSAELCNKINTFLVDL